MYILSIFFAKKFKERWWFYINYYKLNKIIKKDYYLLLLIEEIIARLIRVKIFTKFNIQQIFYYIRLNKKIENLITFCMRYKLYKYKILLFKLCNKLALFQRFMNNALIKYLNDFCTIYVNNILIYFNNFLEHNLYIKKILDYL